MEAHLARPKSKKIRVHEPVDAARSTPTTGVAISQDGPRIGIEKHWQQTRGIQDDDVGVTHNDPIVTRQCVRV